MPMTPAAAAEALLAAIWKDKQVNQNLDWSKIKHDGRTRIMLGMDGGGTQMLYISTGRGARAVTGDAIDAWHLAPLIERVLGDVTIAHESTGELSTQDAAGRLATELGDAGYHAKVWSKKGVRVYVDAADGTELGYLEVVGGEQRVTNRSKLAAKTLAELVDRALGKTVLAKPLDPKQQEAFLRAIAAEPEDDAPRLVYADWLQTLGDPAMRARGEFIVLQCAGKQNRAQLARANELERAYRETWTKGLGLEEWQYVRGFVEAIRMTANELADAARIFAIEPCIRRLRVTSWQESDLAKLPLERIEHLELAGGACTKSMIKLAASPRAKRLATLDLSGCKIAEDGVIALAGSKTLAGLRSLDLRGSPLSSAAVDALLKSKLEQLRFGRAVRSKELRAKFASAH